MHVVKVTSRRANQEYVSYLLRQSYREGSHVKKRTLANLSALPEHVIDAIRRGLAGDPLLPSGPLTIEGTWPHGHVAAVLGTAQAMGLQDNLLLALVATRILHPDAEPTNTRLWHTTTLARTLSLEDATPAEAKAALAATESLHALATAVQARMQTALAPLLANPSSPAAAGEGRVREPKTPPQVHDPGTTLPTLLAELATLTLCRVLPQRVDVTTQPTPLQERAFELLGLPLP